MQWLSLCAATCLFSILCSGVVDTGKVRQAEMLGCEVSGSQRGECYVIIVL
jgi:hypothetical protein